MSETINIISPIDQSTIAQRPVANASQIRSAIEQATMAQADWQHTSLEARARLCHRAVDFMVAQRDEIANEITLQMGRPIRFAGGEINGLEERARYMIDIAEKELQDIEVEAIAGFTRFIRHQPLGTVLTIAPWNYPYLTAINSIIPALMSGNCVILKHSAQTLLCAERFYQAFEQAGLPKGVFQYLHLNHQHTEALVREPSVAYVSFTGSNTGGINIEQALAGHFKTSAFELGGKDPAYVLPDANIEYAVNNLVDGAYFNSGQSCCGVERIYVHENIYDEFEERFINLVRQYQLGDPRDPATTLGPVVNQHSADYIRKQIKQAETAGAHCCIDETDFPASSASNVYVAPQVLTNVDHGMDVMTEETFGPVVGIMKVSHDEQALQLMNDSKYGLTASVWSQDLEHAIALGDKIDTGTVFMNRCDYLDPALAWVGVKQSGRGCSLSKLAYQQFTRPKSFHLKTGL